MDRKEYTPTKQSKLFSGAAYTSNSQQGNSGYRIAQKAHTRRVPQLKYAIDLLDTELHRFRESNSALSDRLSHEYSLTKIVKIGLGVIASQGGNGDRNPHLADIQAQKSRTISNLELQLRNSRNSQRALQHKLTTLTENLLTLEEDIAVMKDRLGNADFRERISTNSCKEWSPLLVKKSKPLSNSATEKPVCGRKYRPTRRGRREDYSKSNI